MWPDRHWTLRERIVGYLRWEVRNWRKGADYRRHDRWRHAKVRALSWDRWLHERLNRRMHHRLDGRVDCGVDSDRKTGPLSLKTGSRQANKEHEDEQIYELHASTSMNVNFLDG